jgi:sigma-B regulation protein RsbU (phosphoserine phosphatase)
MDYRAGLEYRESIFERWTRRFGLYVLAPVLLLLALLVGLHIARAPDYGLKLRQLVAVSVPPGEPAAQAGIEPGDRVREVDGEPIQSMVDYYLAMSGHYELVARRFTLERAGRTFTAIVLPRAPSHARLIWGYSLWLSGLCFLLIGWWVLSRRRDTVARNFFVLCLVFAFFLAEVPDLPSRAYMTLKEVTRDLLQLLWPAFFLRFIIHFPSAGPLSPEQKRRDRLLLLPVVPLFLLSLYAQIAGLDPATSPTISLLQNGAFVYFAVYFLAGLVIFARKVLRQDRPVQHTKLRLVLLGLVAGLMPFLTGVFLGSYFPSATIPHWEWLGFFLLLVPVSFGLAIVRYGALDTAFVVRHGLTYGALTGLLVLVYVILVGVLGQALTSYFRIATYPLVLTTAAGSALLVMPARRAIQGWIDRTFYPARQADRAAILALGQELSGILESEDAADTLLGRLTVLYRPQRISLFEEQAGPGQNGITERLLREVSVREGDQRTTPVYAFSLDSSLGQFLDRLRRPVFVEEFLELRDPVEEDEDGPEDTSLELPQRLDCELLVPLIASNRLSGLLAFGAKASGALYTQDDLANLRQLAVQAAALLESRRLYQESLARRSLETELSVAQQIQSRLLPTEPLQLPGVEIQGRMESSREVGGDYFDYFPLDGRTIGFAVGDVAGKGIPAALLMTTLRVAFHAEAVRHRDPERVVAALNREVARLLSPGEFVSFFYGIYRLDEGILHYCNAGIEPPFLFRHGRDYHESLRRGGPVLGVDGQQVYRRGTVTLRPDDLLVAFTDGLTEQMNDAGDFFDRERLAAAALDWRGLPLDQLGDRIFKSVSEFGGGVLPDDRTLVLLRCVPAAVTPEIGPPIASETFSLS